MEGQSECFAEYKRYKNIANLQFTFDTFTTLYAVLKHTAWIEKGYVYTSHSNVNKIERHCSHKMCVKGV